MEAIKKFFKSKMVLYGIIAMAVAFVAWYMYETNRRNKLRNNWMGWVRTLNETDAGYAQIKQKAEKAGITFDEQLEMDAYYLTPKNVFKPLL